MVGQNRTFELLARRSSVGSLSSAYFTRFGEAPGGVNTGLLSEAL